MNSDADQQSNTPRIDVSLAEIHTLIATLEAQLKLEICPSRLDIKADENSMPKAFAFDREETAFLIER